MFERAAAASPTRPSLKALVAGELREIGRISDAEAVLQDVLSIHPDDFDALTGLAQIARDRGNRSDSLALLERAAKTYPRHAGLKGLMASDQRELGRLDEAERLLREVLQVQPGHLDALTALGQIARAPGDHAAALAWLEAAAIAHPEDAGSKVSAAAELRELDRIGEAERLLRQVLGSHPQHADARVGLGHIERNAATRARRLRRTRPRPMPLQGVQVCTRWLPARCASSEEVMRPRRRCETC
jgi:tetratricopeptide (TPR) repeat protein